MVLEKGALPFPSILGLNFICPECTNKINCSLEEGCVGAEALPTAAVRSPVGESVEHENELKGRLELVLGRVGLVQVVLMGQAGAEAKEGLVARGLLEQGGRRGYGGGSDGGHHCGAGRHSGSCRWRRTGACRGLYRKREVLVFLFYRSVRSLVVTKTTWYL